MKVTDAEPALSPSNRPLHGHKRAARDADQLRDSGRIVLGELAFHPRIPWFTVLDHPGRCKTQATLMHRCIFHTLLYMVMAITGGSVGDDHPGVSPPGPVTPPLTEEDSLDASDATRRLARPRLGFGPWSGRRRAGDVQHDDSRPTATPRADYAAREREAIWMRVWQIVGRVDDLPKPGDWKKYEIFDQSFLIVRGKDEQAPRLRQRLPASRQRAVHRRDRERQARLPLPVPPVVLRPGGQAAGGAAGGPRRPDRQDRELAARGVRRHLRRLRLPQPRPEAAPLREYLGDEVYDLLEPYHIDELTTVMDVREAIDCNWKVVMDAFEEGYHINGIHPQLLA